MEARKREKAVFCWSGGKDSAMALHRVLADERFEVVSLLTTLSLDYDRVSHHGVRRELLEQQAAMIGLPVEKLFVGATCDMDEYERKMEAMHLGFKERGVETVIFGDIFLEPLRKRREENLAKVGMRAHFPLWGEDTRGLIEHFVATGFRAILCSVNTEKLPESFAGREIDSSFLAALPADVDPCGENGEYHSFVYAGPIFEQPIAVRPAQLELRPPMAFRELVTYTCT